MPSATPAFRSFRRWSLRTLVVLATLPPFSTRAQVALFPRAGGRPLIGHRITQENEEVIILEIYRGYGVRVPAAGIEKRETLDLSRSALRNEFEQRRRALAADDVPGRLALAQWARENKLVVQARSLLTDLATRFPRNPAVRAAVPVFQEKTALTAEETAFFEKMIQTFFSGAEGRAQALTALQGRDALPLDAVPEWGRRCFAAARAGRKIKTGDTVFKTGPLATPVHVRQWRKSGDGDENVKWPVVISLHGGGKNSGHWKLGGPMFFELFQKRLDRMIFVAPTVMRKEYARWAAHPDEERQVKEIFKAVKRTWNVDTDRVYLVGYSMGGYGTWHMGGHQADLFAGLASGAGGILIGSHLGETWGWGVIGNLMHTPIAFTHGGKDQPAPPWSDAEADRILRELAARHPGRYRHKYIFLPKAGHALPRSSTEQAVAWIAPSRRNPYPRELIWEPKRDFNRQFYWLTMEKPRIFTRLEARIEDNTVALTTHNLQGGFGVLLNEEIADLRKPVTVTVNGEPVFRGRLHATLSTILNTVDDRIDERQWFSARIDF
jgi:predicted esterase